MMERMIEAVMRRSVLVITSILLIMLWGGVSAYQMQRDYLPAINNSTLMITVKADDLDAARVKSEIASKVEEAVRGVDGLQYLETNSYDGGLFTSLYFPLNYDVERAEQEVTRALDGSRFPEGTEKPAVTRVSTSSFPVMRIGLMSDGKGTGEKQLRTSIEAKVAKEFEHISGVKEVRATGAGSSGYIVTTRMDSLKKAGLTMKDVEQALASLQTAWPEGKIKSDQVQIPIQVKGWNTSADILKQMPIHHAAGQPVPLSAVADISEGMIDLKTISRTDGKPSVLLDVLKTPSSNVTDISERVRERIKETQAALPKDIRLAVLYDYGEQVKQSLSGLLREGLFGCLFAMVCVFAFLRHVRATLLIALTLPICFLVTTGVLKTMNNSLNILTVSGLIVAMGRVVDDSIVILDNIYRRVRENEGKANLFIVSGAIREMLPAVVSSTATTVAVFLPIALVGGMISSAFSSFAWSVVVALITSLFVAVVVIPGLSPFWLKQGSITQDSGRVESIVESVLKRALSHKRRVAAACAFLFAATVAAAILLPVNVLPMGQSGEINIEVELPEQSSLAAVNGEVRKVEALLSREAAVDTFSATLGSSFVPQFDDVFDEGGGWIQRSNKASITVTLKKGTDMEAYTVDLTRKVKATPSKALFTVTNRNIAGDDSRLKIVLTGADTATLENEARIIQSKLQLVNGLSVEGAADNDDSRSAYILALNRERIQRLGIRTEDILQRIEPYLSQGIKLSVRVHSGEVPVVLENDVLASIPAATAGAAVLPGQNIMSALAGETFTAADGNRVPLYQLTSLQHQVRNPIIREQNGRPFAVVSADIVSRDVGDVTGKVNDTLKQMQMPPGITYSMGGISEQVKQMAAEAAIALSISILLVLLIVSFFFRGWRAPLSVLVCIPLAVIGSVWGMFVLDKEWNLTALVGLLMLVGIVVTNGIVLVDKIERKTREGVNLRKAVICGTLTRVRPVLMTAGTTILTILPLSFSQGGDTVVTQTLSIVVVGGMLSSTCISLVIIPILYEWMNRESVATSEKPGETEMAV